jgi:hypothetical protein
LLFNAGSARDRLSAANKGEYGMKNWKQFTFVAILAIFGIVFGFTACDDGNNSNDNNQASNNPNGSNPNGGTLVVNNGTSYNYTVTITFDNNEVFSGTMTPHETIRRTSSNNVEYRILFVRQYPYSQSKIGSLSEGKTIYYNLGE